MTLTSSGHVGNQSPVCDCRVQAWYEGMFDDRYDMPGLYSLMRCTNCGLIRTWPALREEDLGRIYATHYPRKNIDVGSLAEKLQDPISPVGRLRIWVNGIGNQVRYYALPRMTVLDYGCGVGISLLELRAMGTSGYGLEIDSNVRPAAEYFGLRIHIGSLDDEPFPGSEFDLISMNQVIEHVPEPRLLLRMIRKRLRTGGAVVLSIPNVDSLFRRVVGRRWIHWHIPYDYPLIIYHFHQFHIFPNGRLFAASHVYCPDRALVEPRYRRYIAEIQESIAMVRPRVGDGRAVACRGFLILPDEGPRRVRRRRDGHYR